MSNGGAVEIYDSSNPTIHQQYFPGIIQVIQVNQISFPPMIAMLILNTMISKEVKQELAPMASETVCMKTTLMRIPMFADVLALNYHLSYGSPCIDTGDPSIFDPNGTLSDMGAYYYPVPATPVALAATEVYTNYFTANWQEAFDADEYYLDVAEDENFENIISGNIQVVNATNYTVTVPDLSWVYYRVRANNAYGFSEYSNTIQVELITEIKENLAEVPVIIISPNPVSEKCSVRIISGKPAGIFSNFMIVQERDWIYYSMNGYQ